VQETVRKTGQRDAYLTAAGTVGVTFKKTEDEKPNSFLPNDLRENFFQYFFDFLKISRVKIIER
jgi:hypothetical protein